MPPFITDRPRPPAPTSTSGSPTFTWTSPSSAETATSTVVTARPDPLLTRAANGTSFTPIDRISLEARMREALALGADVPARVQDGPTCGLYALGMVMDFWDKRDPKNTNPLVRTEDVLRWDSHTQAPDTQLRLLDVAKAKGYTTQGEMFYAHQLASLARSFGYSARTRANMTLDDIKACVDRKHPALVGFDVDNSGNPGLFGGKRAHWAVIEGYFQKDGVDYLVATHGWTGKEYIWKASDFMASVNQLDKSDFPAAPKDITRTLKARLVEVWPRNP